MPSDPKLSALVLFAAAILFFSLMTVIVFGKLKVELEVGADHPRPGAMSMQQRGR